LKLSTPLDSKNVDLVAMSKHVGERGGDFRGWEGETHTDMYAILVVKLTCYSF